MLLTVAGLDPALSNLGMVKATIDLADPDYPIAIQRMELVETKPEKQRKNVRKNRQDLKRVKKLHRALTAFIADVNLVFAEIPVGSQSSRASVSYGVCLGLLVDIRKPLIQLSPDEVKIAACGSRTASKEEMIAWASALYPDAGWLTRKHRGQIELLGKNEHLADAVGTIHAGLLTDQFEQVVGILGAT